MKDLLKICRRYIIMAVLTVCLVLAVNIIFIQNAGCKRNPLFSQFPVYRDSAAA